MTSSSNPRQIVHVSFQDPDHLIGGQGWAVYNLCMEQISQGIKVDWISPCVRDEQAGEFHRLENKLKIIKIHIDNEKVVSLYKIDELTLQLRKRFGDRFFSYIRDHYSPGECIVHLHGFQEVPSRAKELKQARYHVVSTFHMLLSKRCGAVGGDKSILMRLEELEREAIEANSQIIVPSYGMKRDIQSIDPQFAGSIIVIENGVGDEYFDTPINVPQYNKPLVMGYGRISPEKGWDLFLSAAKLTTDRRSQQKIAINYLLFGICDPTLEPYRGYLKHLEESTDGYSNIRLLTRPEGFLGKEKLSTIDQALIGVVPSLYEPFGMVIPEFMARAKPVITTSLPGAIDTFQTELLGRNPYGFMVNADAEDLADAIEWVLDHPDVSQDMGQQGQQRAQDFRWKKVCEKIMSVYSEQ